jgi:hypothetical protein
MNNDVGKLMFAENITSTQKALLADMKFRTRSVSGTLEITHKIGRTGFWASVVYGNGIFMRISPGERHNYLASRLSRYCSADMYVTHASAKEERARIGADRSNLEPFAKHVFDVHVPGYDVRIQFKRKTCVAAPTHASCRYVLCPQLSLVSACARTVHIARRTIFHVEMVSEAAQNSWVALLGESTFSSARLKRRKQTAVPTFTSNSLSSIYTTPEVTERIADAMPERIAHASADNCV